MTPENDEIDNALWRSAVGRRLDTFETRLEENTQLTQRIDKNTADMVAMFNNWKGAMQALDMLGRVAKPLSFIVGFFGGLIGIVVAWKSGAGK